ncbi:MAG: ABC transporter substrate-binding protein, partial [Deltaproteobacteria bacterium]|nr:ABC transporter substrate-binding protein [Deltaproteobacteria bacterium]
VYLAMEDDIITLDPFLHDDSITHSVLSNIYDALVSFDAEMHIIPALAISWENRDEKIWRFYLRPGVKFHDGRKLTAGDVKYSLERAAKAKVGHYLSAAGRINIIDETTLEIITEKPYPLLLNKLSFISIIPDGSPEPVTSPVGTGAYRFQSYVPGGDLWLTANPDYWRGAPMIKKAVIVAIPDDSARCQALFDGRVQIIRDVGERYLNVLKANPEVEYLSRPGLGVTFLGINFKAGGPLTSRKVRQAIYLALDPLLLINESQAEAEPTDQMVTPYIVGYLPKFSPQRPQPQKALKLLKEAGYPAGFAVDLEMSRTAALRSGPHIARQLGKLGIKVNTRAYDWQEMMERLDNGRSPFFLVGWSNSSGDASDFNDACLHTKVRGSYGNANWGGYSNRELDRLIEHSQSVIDSKARMTMLQQILLKALDDLPYIPLYVRHRTYGVSRRIRFRPRQDGRIRFFDMEYSQNKH